MNVKPGQLVIVQNEAMLGVQCSQDWWMGQVLHCTDGAEHLGNHNLFQIIDFNPAVDPSIGLISLECPWE